MKVIHLDSVYQSTNEKTQATWLENEGIGSIRETPDYDPTKLALATGIRPTMPAQIQQLFNKLNDLVRDDVLADRLPEACFHFTFLPLTLPLYAENEVLPEKISQLGEMWADYQARRITVRELRLVALPGQLLLAGFRMRRRLRCATHFVRKFWHHPGNKNCLPGTLLRRFRRLSGTVRYCATKPVFCPHNCDDTSSRIRRGALVRFQENSSSSK